MIVGIGTDIVNLNRFETTFMHERRLDKVFTALERAYADTKFEPFQHYAGMWAAKEAYMKASGNMNLDMLKIQIHHPEQGAPYIYLGNHVNPTYKIHLSISHDVGYATATVVIEKREFG